MKNDAAAEAENARAEHAHRMERNLQTVALLHSWLDDDESDAEQRTELEWLMRVLDEDRPSARNLFS